MMLWRAAGRLIAAHPILGVGPDNFRLTYAPDTGARSDARIHSNNMYLEVLAGGGIVAAVAFAWLLWTAARMYAAGIARADGSAAMATALAAAGIAMLVHGMVDAFLEFTPIYTMFSLTLGLAAACARGVERRADAHRV